MAIIKGVAHMGNRFSSLNCFDVSMLETSVSTLLLRTSRFKPVSEGETGASIEGTEDGSSGDKTLSARLASEVGWCSDGESEEGSVFG